MRPALRLVHLLLEAVLLAGCVATPEVQPRLPTFTVDALPDPGEVASVQPAATVALPTTNTANPGARAPRAAAVPTPAVRTPPPVAAGGGGSGGGSGSGPAPGPTSPGRVVSIAGGTEQPLAGATVTTTDGRQATSDATGTFVLPGSPPADGVYEASAPGFATSVVVGFSGGPLVLHLKPAVTSGVAAPAPTQHIQVTGEVVDPTGQPLPNVLVALGDAAGSTSNPSLTGAGGRFVLDVVAPGGVVQGGTLLAVASSGAYMGMATGLACTAPATALDFDATTPGADPLALVAADHPVTVTLDGAAIATRPHTEVDLVAPDGTRLGLYDASTFRAANVPGAHYAFRAQALDPTNGVESDLVLDNLGIDFATADTSVSTALLSPPGFVTSPSLAPGSAWSWGAVPGATGYNASLTAVDAAKFVWEAFTTATRLDLTTPAPFASGHYELVLAAWDAPDASPRTIASVGSPRRLRVFPLGASYRRAERRLQVRL